MTHSNPSSPVTADFRQQQQALRSGMRLAMLDAAQHLLQTEGLAGFTVRRVAQAVNCSTTLLYSQFGGKDGLSNELYLEGFARLKQVFSGQPQAEVQGVERLRTFARLYRDFAHHQPSYYLIMFGDGLVGFVPPQESRQTAWQSFEQLIAHFSSCMQQGLLPHSNPTAAARLLWAAMHGVIHLELKGYYLTPAQANDLYAASVEAALLAVS